MLLPFGFLSTYIFRTFRPTSLHTRSRVPLDDIYVPYTANESVEIF